MRPIRGAALLLLTVLISSCSPTSAPPTSSNDKIAGVADVPELDGT